MALGSFSLPQDFEFEVLPILSKLLLLLLLLLLFKGSVGEVNCLKREKKRQTHQDSNLGPCLS